MRWVSNNEDRIVTLENLLKIIQLDKCSANGIKAVIKIHVSLLDRTPMVYKLLINTLADITTDSSIADTVVVIGGEEDDDTVSRVCWRVNPSTEIENLCEIPVDDLAVKFSVCITPLGFLITGGEGKRLCIMYATKAKSWVKLQDLIVPRDSHGSICVQNVFYVFGGYLGENTTGIKPSASVQSMKMDHGRWQSGCSAPLAVKFPNVSNLGKMVYLLDGENSNRLWRLDVDENVWTELAKFPAEKSCHGVSMASAWGRLFLAGGQRKICAWYQPETNTWCTGQTPLRKHAYGALAYHDDKLLLIGGNYKDRTDLIEGGTDEMEEYNIEEDKWSLCKCEMPRKIQGFHAVVLNAQPCD